jgi:hypothetical protein
LGSEVHEAVRTSRVKATTQRWPMYSGIARMPAVPPYDRAAPGPHESKPASHLRVFVRLPAAAPQRRVGHWHSAPQLAPLRQVECLDAVSADVLPPTRHRMPDRARQGLPAKGLETSLGQSAVLRRLTQACECRAIGDHRAAPVDRGSFAREILCQHPVFAAARIPTGEVTLDLVL